MRCIAWLPGSNRSPGEDTPTPSTVITVTFVHLRCNFFASAQCTKTEALAPIASHARSNSNLEQMVKTQDKLVPYRNTHAPHEDTSWGHDTEKTKRCRVPNAGPIGRRRDRNSVHNPIDGRSFCSEHRFSALFIERAVHVQTNGRP
jgi:hypothetical protein